MGADDTLGEREAEAGGGVELDNPAEAAAEYDETRSGPPEQTGKGEDSAAPTTRYFACQCCNKKKIVEEEGEEKPMVDLPQHVTLHLHRVESGGMAEGRGSGGGKERKGANLSRAGASGMAGLQPSAVFAQPGGTFSGSAASSFILLGQESNLSSNPTHQNVGLNLQSHLNRLNLHSQQQQSPAAPGAPHPGQTQASALAQRHLRQALGGSSTVEDSFIDIGTAGSHLGLGPCGAGTHGGAPLKGHPTHHPPVTQVVQVCTSEHADKLKQVKDLLDAFEKGEEGEMLGGKLPADEGAQSLAPEAPGSVEKYLCGDCALLLQEEMERMISECELDCQAYQQALQRLEKGPGAAGNGAQPVSAAHFDKEMERIAEEEERENRRIAELEGALASLGKEKKDLEVQALDLDRTERDYWKRFNHFRLELDAHVEEKEAIISKIEAACSHLDTLKRTNIYNDVFHIWHDGPFGTINSFRMGKTNKIQVEWDEINAAWGQAVLLLHTMASSCDEFEFSQNRLVPMGSYPKISDGKNTYELYGPVTQFLRANYDKAM